jgi:hypothetical protein
MYNEIQPGPVADSITKDGDFHVCQHSTKPSVQHCIAKAWSQSIRAFFIFFSAGVLRTSSFNTRAFFDTHNISGSFSSPKFI